MNRQVILKTNFRLFGIMLFLFGAGGLSATLVFGQDVPWIFNGIFILMMIFGLRMVFKNTSHEIHIDNHQLGWVVNGNDAGNVDINDIAGIDIRSYWWKTQKRRNLKTLVVVTKKDGFETLIPRNCYINTSVKHIEKALKLISDKSPTIKVSTNEFENNPGYKKFIDWNTSLSNKEWAAHLEPNPSGKYYNCEVEVEFRQDGRVELEIDIREQDREIRGPLQILIDNHLLATLDQDKTKSVKKKTTIDKQTAQNHIQAGKIVTVKDPMGYEWRGPLMYYR